MPARNWRKQAKKKERNIISILLLDNRDNVKNGGGWIVFRASWKIVIFPLKDYWYLVTGSSLDIWKKTYISINKPGKHVPQDCFHMFNIKTIIELPFFCNILSEYLFRVYSFPFCDCKLSLFVMSHKCMKCEYLKWIFKRSIAKQLLHSIYRKKIVLN